jgi:hypothetical protein
MKTTALAGALGLLAAVCLPTAPTQALNRTWVSGTGNDANPCTRAQPCLTFDQAHSVTDPGGSINCIDAGDYGAVGIVKSITIDCTGTFAASSASVGSAILINAAGIFVTLRGLSIEGRGTAARGVRVTQASVVQIEQCRISGFQAGEAMGIQFIPTGGGNLFVSDTVITKNGAGAVGGGIVIDPGAGSAFAVLQRVQLQQNSEGLTVTGAGGGGAIVSVIDSQASLNGRNGFVAVSPPGGALAGIEIDSSFAILNNLSGVLADGAAAHVTIGASQVLGNSTGLGKANGGNVFSYGNNSVNTNGSNGSPSPINPL